MKKKRGRLSLEKYVIFFYLFILLAWCERRSEEFRIERIFSPFTSAKRDTLREKRHLSRKLLHSRVFEWKNKFRIVELAKIQFFNYWYRV
jgi:hypothetical protein